MRAYLNTTGHKDLTIFFVQTNDSKALAQFAWEGENEFHYNNEMYDVIEKRAEGGHLLIRCISDKKETALIKDFQKAGSDQSRQKSNLLSNLISLQYIKPAINEIAINNGIKNTFSATYTFFLKEQIKTILTPPPQVI